MQQILVDSNFDGGSIEVVNLDNLEFRIKPDTNSHFAQWFYFRLDNVGGQLLTLTFLDMDKTAFPEGWEGYDIFVSYDNHDWFRLPTTFANNQLTFSLEAGYNSVYFAYFEPYSYQRQLKLLKLATEAGAVHQVIGQTHHHHGLDLLTIGDSQAEHKIWVIASQHPGETMARWFIEGLVHRLINGFEGMARHVLKSCVFYIVPNMNPDGAILGNLRVNSVGANLNREWQNPTLERSPEVVAIQAMMAETGVDMFFDIHGDEAIPYIFRADCDEIPSYSDKQKRLSQAFESILLQVVPQFQLEYGYEKGHFNEETLTLANNWVGDKYGCLSMVIEIPFKDLANDVANSPVCSWNGGRSFVFGWDFLTAIGMMLPHLG